jgi:DNA-binding CsgD family transcriptional regulator
VLVGKLSLHDIDCVESFSVAIVKRSRLRLNFHEHEDLVCYRSKPPGSSRSASDREESPSPHSQDGRSGCESWTGNESTMGERSGNSPGSLTSANSPGLSVSMSNAIDWTTLSPRAQAILRTVATPISQGFSLVEIARELGTSPSWVSSRIQELRVELAGFSRTELLAYLLEAMEGESRRTGFQEAPR